MTKIASFQMDVYIGETEKNLRRILDRMQQAKAAGAELALFPEAAVTGYCVGCQADAVGIGISPSVLEPLREASDRLDILAVVGFAETDGSTVWNSATLFEPGRKPRIYRKTHLPHLGLDRFVEAGDSLEVFDTRIGNLGILICFDMRFPEGARTLTLKGADLVVIPTNWLVGAETSANYIAIARAAENRIFVATCNRVGTENGFTFIGQSKIIDPDGRLLATAGAGEEMILADCDLEQSRIKNRVIIPGEYETNVLARRPDLYAG